MSGPLAMREIARQTGVAPSTVSRRIKKGLDPWTGEWTATPIAPPDRMPAKAREGIRKRPPMTEEAEALIIAGIESGQRVADIAREIGIPRMWVYRHAAEVGIDVRQGFVPPDPITLRKAIEDMRPADALEYVLEAYEQISGQDDAAIAEGLRLGLQPMQAVPFGMMLRSIGKTVPHKRMLAACLAVSERTSPKSINVQICRMRRKLAGRYRIALVWGAGYRMEKDNV